MARTVTDAVAVDASAPEASAAPTWARHRSLWRDAVRSFFRRRSAIVGLALVSLFLVTALVGELGTPYDPYRSSLRERLQPPSAAHILGTDGFGRDIFSRILRGASITLVIGVVAVTIGVILGSVQGLIAGYFRGWIGAVIMRFVDALQAFPLILLALAIMATLGRGPVNVMVAVGIATMPRFARMMQAESLSVSRRDYVTAARAIGASTWRILFQHVLPNSLSSVIVMATLYVATAILTEATLSFLGLGPPPPTATWGSMVNDGSNVLHSSPWVAVFPGLAITIVVLGFSLAGDGLRDALDAKLRDR
ncbi:MAG: ABC transporter permease [Chloroflexi bacterium]|nr:ABC transporter permease [Chloroflexota bacterium]